MLLSEMKLEVRDRLGETTENFFKDTAILRALNEGVRRFCYEDEWPWLQRVAATTLASAAETFALTAEVDPNRQMILQFTPSAGDTRIREIKRVSTVQGEKLRVRYSGAGVVTDEPLYWYLRSSSVVAAYTVRVVPKADKAYTVAYVYYAAPVVLAVDADIPNIPEQYQMAAVHYAVANQWRKELSAGAKAQEEMMSYMQILEAARKNTKSQAPDEMLVWGGIDPEYQFDADWTRLHMPESL